MSHSHYQMHHHRAHSPGVQYCSAVIEKMMLFLKCMEDRSPTRQRTVIWWAVTAVALGR
jgi:hypothetical protein